MTTSNRRRFLKVTLATGMATAYLGQSDRCWGASSGPIDVDAFFKSVSEGNTDSVRGMIQSNKQLLNARDSAKRSGFTVALLNGHPDLASLLKEAGYQCDLHEAALALDWTEFDRLAKQAGVELVKQINRQHPLGGTAMFAAAAGGAGTQMWRIYAKCGDPDLTPRGINGVSPLQKALRYSDLATAELSAAALLSNACDPNPTGKADLPPLHIAAERGSADIVEILIRRGAKVDARGNHGQTALQLAKKTGNATVIKLLTNHSAIPRTCDSSRSAVDKDGQPYRQPDWKGIPITDRSDFVGSSHRELEKIKALTKRDPRLVHSVATTGEISVEAGAHMGQKPIVEFLLRQGAPYSLPTAVMMNDMATVKRLLNEDPNRIHERGAHGFALLWYPIIGNCPLGMMEYLCDRGAKVEEQHFLGTTALHWACRFGRLKEVEFLIQQGADVNRIGRKFNGKSESPLQLTREPKVAQLLKSHGAT